MDDVDDFVACFLNYERTGRLSIFVNRMMTGHAVGQESTRRISEQGERTMNKQITHVTLPVCITILVVGAWWVNAGDLNPPAGAVSPTMKNLDDVEPRTAIRNDLVAFTPIVISASGSYYLAENIDARPSQHGIEITASEVTLDLNGFSVRGNTEVVSLDGIHATGALLNIAVKNGTVRDFSGTGVAMSTADNSQVIDVRVNNTGWGGAGTDGIALGEGGILSRCQVRDGGDDGFDTGAGCIVTYCTAMDNDNFGFFLGNANTVSSCMSMGHLNDGFWVSRSVITACVSKDNQRGFMVVGPSMLSDSGAFDNGEHGILAGASTVHGNAAVSNFPNIDGGGSTEHANYAP